MGYTDIITREADSNKEQPHEYIEHFKEKQSHTGGALSARTPEEIEAFLRSFNVNTSSYKFDRDDANAR
jgi:hypothetical protein